MITLKAAKDLQECIQQGMEQVGDWRVALEQAADTASAVVNSLEAAEKVADTAQPQRPSITEFLLARIAEDEAAASAATAGPWRYNPGKAWHQDKHRLAAARAGNPFILGEEFVGAGPAGNDETLCVATTGRQDHPEAMADAAHIARHHPARVLAEAAAKRAIIGYFEMLCEQEKQAEVFGYHATGLLVAIRKLATVYKDHPDYQEDWAQ